MTMFRIIRTNHMITSNIIYQHHLDKVAQLSSHSLLGCSGPNSDFVNFSQYCKKNMTLYELNNNNERLSVKVQANFCRRELARALRKGPFQVNCLLGGYDEDIGSQLYFLDYLASLQKVNFGVQGYASNFCMSIFDRERKPALTQEEALTVIDHCIEELKTRFLISQPNFMIKAVDKDGVKILKCDANPADHE